MLVNGLPGSGKTTLAHSVSEGLGLPMLSKDVVKETLFDWLGAGDRERSRQLGRASAETLWAVLACCPRGAVLDFPMSWQVRDVIERHLVESGAQRHCELWCDVTRQVAFDRVKERAANGRHPGHLDGDLAELPAEWDDLRPLGLGPVLRVPTAEPVDTALVCDWIRAELQMRAEPS